MQGHGVLTPKRSSSSRSAPWSLTRATPERSNGETELDREAHKASALNELADPVVIALLGRIVLGMQVMMMIRPLADAFNSGEREGGMWLSVV
jgi:hypothetical protein